MKQILFALHAFIVPFSLAQTLSFQQVFKGNNPVRYIKEISNGFVFAGLNKPYWYFNYPTDAITLRSTDKGKTWETVPIATNDISQLGNTLFASGHKVYKSIDSGKTWLQVYDTSSTDNETNFIVSRGSFIVAGFFFKLDQGGYQPVGWMLKSEDGGNTWRPWTRQDEGFVAGVITAEPSYIYSSEFALYKMTDFNTSRGTFVAYNNWGLIHSLLIYSPKKWYIGTGKPKTESGSNEVEVSYHRKSRYYEGVFRSLDEGKSWKQMNVGLKDTVTTSLANLGENTLVVGTLGGGVFLSKNGGDNWQEINTGIADKYITAVTITQDGTVYVGTSKGYIYKSNRSILVANEPEAIPTHLTLSPQNYPNPFNPSTNISFALPQAGQVHLEVFDVLGRSVGVLANRPFEAGRHEIMFDAKDLPSGIYVYRLKVGDTIITKKMNLIK